MSLSRFFFVQLWADIRYQSLPEARRLQLFNEFLLEVRQQQEVADAAAAEAAAAADAAAAAAAPSVPAAPGSNGTSSPAAGSFSTLSTEDLDLEGVDAAGMAPEDLAKLQLLRWEQQRLRQEYQKMEEQLRKIEQQIRSNTSSPVAGAAPDVQAGASAAAVAAADSNGAADQAAVEEEEPVEPVVEALANGEPMNVVVEGGDGDVSVEVNRDGVVVFKFAEGGGSRTTSPVASGPSSAGGFEP